jgi:integrase
MRTETIFPHVFEDVKPGGKYSYLRFIFGGHHVAMMPKPAGSPAFLTKHQELMNQVTAGTLPVKGKEDADAAPVKRQRARLGSLAWAIQQYFASKDFLGLADSTRDNQRRYGDWLASQPFARHPFTKLCPQVVREVRNRIANAERPAKAKPGEPRPPYQPYGTATADAIALYFINTLWEFVAENLGNEINLGKLPNPTTGVKRKHTKDKRESHERWPEAVIDEYFDGADDYEAAACALLLFTGQRESDVVNMKPEDVIGPRISVVQQKTGGRVRIKMLRQLIEALDRLPKGGERLLMNKRGTPYTAKTLYRLVKGRLNKIGAGHLVPHGLRASAACRLYEVTHNIELVADVLGHESTATTKGYIRQARRERGADKAMDAYQAALDAREIAAANDDDFDLSEAA